MTEKIVTLFFLIVSTMYLYFANGYAIGTLTAPLAGFMPTLAALSAIFVSLYLLYRQFKGDAAPPPADKVDWTKFIFIMIGMLFYLMLFKLLGYFFTTFIFLFYLYKLAEPRGWLKPFKFAFITSGLCLLIFKIALGVILP